MDLTSVFFALFIAILKTNQLFLRGQESVTHRLFNLCLGINFHIVSTGYGMEKYNSEFR